MAQKYKASVHKYITEVQLQLAIALLWECQAPALRFTKWSISKICLFHVLH